MLDAFCATVSSSSNKHKKRTLCSGPVSLLILERFTTFLWLLSNQISHILNKWNNKRFSLEIWDYYYYYIITLLQLRVTERPLTATTSPLSHYFPLVRVFSIPYPTQRCAAGSVTSSTPVKFFICSCCCRWFPRSGCLERPLPSGTHGEESRPLLVAGDEAAATNKEKTERCWQTPLLWCVARQFIWRGKAESESKRT